jgi:hypothetical protein
VYRHCRLCPAARDETPGLWFSVVAASAARNVYELDLREELTMEKRMEAKRGTPGSNSAAIEEHVLNSEHGCVNVPKDFYAKARTIYNVLQKDMEALMEKIRGKEYREIIAIAKDHLSFKLIDGEKVRYAETPTTEQTTRRINAYQEQYKLLEELERGGFQALSLAFEYILVNRERNTPWQTYSLLNVCEKCYPP